MSAQVVLLMAGSGSRFAVRGYTDSKPLIEVEGMPMFARALESLRSIDVRSVRAVVRQRQVDEEDIDSRLQEVAPEIEIVVIPAMTRGAAESALAGTAGLDPDRPLIVLDCDLEFRSAAYERSVRELSSDPFDVLLLTFAASDPRFSYARSDRCGRVDLVAEKQVVSDRAIAGAYCFARTADFISSARSVATRGTRGGVPELYMSEVVRDRLNRGAVVRQVPVDSYASFGTPEELDEFLGAVRV